jgi:carboxymethylenebutenolidase
MLFKSEVIMNTVKTKSRFLDIKTTDGACDSYVSFPNDDSPHPAVLLMMDAFGLRRYLYEMADTLAEQGFYVLAPNLFYRMKRSPMVEMPFPLNMEELQTARGMFGPLMQKFTPADTLKDMEQFFSFLETQKEVKKGKVGLTGYCLGGNLAIRTAGTYPDKIGAAASFHGGNLATDKPDSVHLLLPKIKAALYVAHADNDAHMTEAQIKMFDEALKNTSLKYESEKYKEAAHGFTMKDLPMYNEAALNKHWKKLPELFKQNL